LSSDLVNKVIDYLNNDLYIISFEVLELITSRRSSARLSIT